MGIPSSLAFADKSPWCEILVDLYWEHGEALRESIYNILRDDIETDKVINDAYGEFLADESLMQVSREELKRKLFDYAKDLSIAAKKRTIKKMVRMIKFGSIGAAIGLLGGFGPKLFPECAGLLYGLTAVSIIALAIHVGRPSGRRSR